MPKAKRTKAKTSSKSAKAGPADVKVLIVLDESGSMQACKDSTVRGFNENVQAIKKERPDADVSLVVFNYPGKDRTILWNQKAEGLRELTDADYIPDGNTALCDAVCNAIDKLGDDGKSSYLVTILTDSEENASQTFHWADMAERIQARQKTGRWTFTYVGANQDLHEVARRTGIPLGNLSSYQSTPTGSAAVFAVSAHSTRSYMAGTKKGLTSSASFYGTKGQISNVPDPGKPTITPIPPAPKARRSDYLKHE
jgi:hypothetical protein